MTDDDQNRSPLTDDGCRMMHYGQDCAHGDVEEDAYEFDAGTFVAYDNEGDAHTFMLAIIVTRVAVVVSLTMLFCMCRLRLCMTLPAMLVYV